MKATWQLWSQRFHWSAHTAHMVQAHAVSRQHLNSRGSKQRRSAPCATAKSMVSTRWLRRKSVPSLPLYGLSASRSGDQGPKNP